MPAAVDLLPVLSDAACLLPNALSLTQSLPMLPPTQSPSQHSVTNPYQNVGGGTGIGSESRAGYWHECQDREGLRLM